MAFHDYAVVETVNLSVCYVTGPGHKLQTLLLEDTRSSDKSKIITLMTTYNNTMASFMCCEKNTEASLQSIVQDMGLYAYFVILCRLIYTFQRVHIYYSIHSAVQL